MLTHLTRGALILAVLALALASAAAGKGNESKGRFYFKQTCKECHVKGAAGGELSPLSKTMEQWRKFFAAGKHAKGKEPLSQVMADDKLTDVKTFVVSHAADSLQPETCGK